MRHKLCRSFHPWCPGVKNRCLYIYLRPRFSIFNSTKWAWCDPNGTFVNICWQSSLLPVDKIPRHHCTTITKGGTFLGQWVKCCITQVVWVFVIQWSSRTPRLPTGINTLMPKQNGRHFPDDILKCIFFNENVWISIKISLKFDPKCSMNNIPELVQIMALRRPGDKPLSEPMTI